MKKPSFLALPKPAAVCIMKEPTVEAAIAEIRNGEFEGAPAFAVHLEGLGRENLTRDNLSRITGATSRPVMLLHYRPNPNPFTEEERAELMLRCAECGAAAVDLPADTFDPSPLEFSEDPGAVRRQREVIGEIHARDTEVILSSHVSRSLTHDRVLYQMQAMEQRGADFVKLVSPADTEEEFLEALRTTLTLRRELRTPFIHLCSGKFAQAHRFFAPKLGNAVTFCVTHYSDHYITCQPHLRNMLTVLESIPWDISQTL